jgi:cytochrome c553
VATVRGCVDCHGENLAGRVMIDDPALGRVVTANLTNGRAAGPLTDADWDAAVRHGVGRDGRALLVMPSQEFAPISDEDLAAVAAYARSLPAVRAALPGNALGPVGRALIAAGVFKMAPDLIDHGRPHVARVTAEPTAAFGRYLAVSCTGCHGEGFGGGKPPGAPPQFKPAANLTPAGIGHYTEADFFRALREGRRPGGVPIDTAMPWKLYRHMDDTEIRAVYAYLRTLPPKPYGSR